MFSRQRARAKKGRWARWRRWRRSRSTSSLELLSLSQLSSQFSPSFFAIRSFLTEFNLHYYVLLTCILLLSSLLNHPLSSCKSRAGSNFDKQPGAQLAAFNFLQGWFCRFPNFSKSQTRNKNISWVPFKYLNIPKSQKRNKNISWPGPFWSEQIWPEMPRSVKILSFSSRLSTCNIHFLLHTQCHGQRQQMP